MRKLILSAVMILAFTQVWAQEELVPVTIKQSEENRNFRIPLIGQDAPAFVAESTNGLIHFPADFTGRWKVLFSHPQDFTPVCSSELIELANNQKEFKKLGADLIVISTDPVETHENWIDALEKTEYKGRPTEKIKFPLVGDDDIVVSKKYGMISTESNSTRDVRGVFIVDPQNVVRAVSFYPNNVGRNIDEILRTVRALQLTAKEKVATPAGWKEGDDVIVPVPPTANQSDPDYVPAGYQKLNWFMWFKGASAN